MRWLVASLGRGLNDDDVIAFRIGFFLRFHFHDSLLTHGVDRFDHIGNLEKDHCLVARGVGFRALTFEANKARRGDAAREVAGRLIANIKTERVAVKRLSSSR